MRPYIKKDKEKIHIVLYNLVLALAPILGIYVSFIPGISWGEVALMGFVFLCLLKKHITAGITGYEKILLLFAVYAFLISIFSCIAGIYQFQWFSRTLRFLMYTGAIVITARKMFRKSLFFRFCYYLSIVICISLLLQYLIFYTSGQYLQLYGHFLTLMDESRMDIDYETIIGYSFFRPSSFFTEPAHVSQFLIIPLAFYLFDRSFPMKKRILAIVASVTGIVLTTSLWGFALLFFVFVMWYIRQVTKKKGSKWLLALPMFVLLLFAVGKTEIFQNSISRINFSNVDSSATFSLRFGGYNNLQKIGPLRLIFGSGFGNTNNLDYSNSIYYLLSGTGVIGLFIWLIISVKMVFSDYDLWAKILFGCFFLLLFGSSVILSLTYAVMFISIIGSQNKSIKRNEL